jgi:mannose-1-phosphate guanylyltransferase/mannose-6-phosphate isomerase
MVRTPASGNSHQGTRRLLITPVILVGGAGMRLWPASTDARPKPFLPLANGTSTFDATLDRVADRSLFNEPLIVANNAHRALVESALARRGVQARLLLEPVGRDTAGAIAAAAAFVAAGQPDDVLLILSADHVIADKAGFTGAVRLAAPAVEAGRIVVFGVTPDHPSTGFGYIKPGAPFSDGVYEVAAFREKPDTATAADYVGSGYLWNSGYFMLTAATALAELALNAPDVVRAAGRAVADSARDGDVFLLDAEAFSSAPRISFDYAVMEKTARAAVVAARFDWSDLGTWAAVYDTAQKDAAGNVVSGEVLIADTTGSYVTTDRAVVGVLGLHDMVVVASDNQVLVAPRDRVGEVKALVGRLHLDKEREIAGRSIRPWGYYQSVDRGEGYQVKRIVVTPGQRLSLQKHARRAEHWTVVAGMAEVTVDGMVMNLAANQSVFIPLGAVHRLANPGSVPVTVIEVQCGDYLGEDDIVRLEDDYRRD